MLIFNVARIENNVIKKVTWTSSDLHTVMHDKDVWRRGNIKPAQSGG